MNKPEMNKPVRLPIPASEKPYATFMRHFSTVDDDRPAPQPLDPKDRVIRDAVATLAEVMDRLVRTEVDIIGHLPDAVRLKLSRLILTTAEKAEATHTALVNFARHGTLASPNHRAQNRHKPFKS